MGSGPSLQLRADGKEIGVEIIRDMNSGTQYLTVKTGDQQVVKKGAADSFDLAALQQLTADVLRDTADGTYSGRVEVTASSFKVDVPRGNTAYAKNILDGVIAGTEKADGREDISYDVALKIGETSYGLNSETGHFFREIAGEKVFAQAEGQLLRVIKIRLGILNATAS